MVKEREGEEEREEKAPSAVAIGLRDYGVDLRKQSNSKRRNGWNGERGEGKVESEGKGEKGVVKEESILRLACLLFCAGIALRILVSAPEILIT